MRPVVSGANLLLCISDPMGEPCAARLRAMAKRQGTLVIQVMPPHGQDDPTCAGSDARHIPCGPPDGADAVLDASDDERLIQFARAVVEPVHLPNLFPVDWADYRLALGDTALTLGTGRARGPSRVDTAVHRACADPCLGIAGHPTRARLARPRAWLASIRADETISLEEIFKAIDKINLGLDDHLTDEAMVIMSAVIDPCMTEELCVNLVACR